MLLAPAVASIDVVVEVRAFVVAAVVCSSTAHLFHGRSKGPPLIFLRQLFLISLALCWVSRKAEGSKAGRWADWQTGLPLLRLVTTTLDLKKRTNILKLETAQLQTF